MDNSYSGTMAGNIKEAKQLVNEFIYRLGGLKQMPTEVRGAKMGKGPNGTSS